MSALPTQSYKGARDFYPEDKRVQKYLLAKWRKVVEGYGYEEYDAPLLELTDLYRAKSGEELVNQQLYSFKDRGGRDVAIRPEMTPSVARMVAAQRQELAYPARWYSIPNLWRYERPQRGRLREHWQLNVDIFGVETIDAELELIMIADELMQAFGATHKMYQIKVNSRKLVNLIMAEYLELDVMQAQLMTKLLDRKDKIADEEFIQEATQIFDASQADNIKKLQSILSAHSMADLPEVLRESSAMKEIQALFTLLTDYGISNATFDVGLVRGFDYYTDIVFEVFDLHPDNSRSIFGGGRYDGLIGLFGVEPVPTVGFGLGDVTMRDFLQTHGLLPVLESETDVYIVVIGDVLHQAQRVASELREEGINVAVDIAGRKAEKQIKTALKKHIPYMLFVGEQEIADDLYTLKDTKTHEEQKLSLERVVSTVADYRRGED